MRLHWVEAPAGRLATSAAPSASALVHEVSGLAAERVDVVASCLQPDEALAMGLAEEGTSLAAAGIHFVHEPIPDFGTPTAAASTDAVVQDLAHRMRGGAAVVVHCRAGIGRSSTLAGCVLVELGIDPESAMDAISAARGFRVPETQGQRMWVHGYERRRGPVAG